MVEPMRGLSSTVRFLQEENQRLLERNEELEQENAYLHDTLKSLKGLVDAVARLNVAEDLERLLNRTVYEAVRIVDAVEGSLLIIDPATDELVFVAARSEMRDRLIGYRIPIDTGIVGWVIQHQEAVIANDVRQDERFSSAVDRAFQFTTRSLMAVPLICCAQPLGAIELVNKFSDQPFNERDIDTLSLLSPIAAMVIELANKSK
ncbi:MAG TPA: GAF domain-containing protein [Anaerolineae bacterium]|nr:GAF domain-containing protein [Anaerolineae bacterium]